MSGLANFTIVIGRMADGSEMFRCTFAEFCEANADSIANDPRSFAEFVEKLNHDRRSGPWFGLGDPDEYLIFEPDQAPPAPDAAPADAADTAGEPAHEFPDIGELVAAIEQAEPALAEAQRMICGNDFTDDRSLFQSTPFYAALKLCRDTLSDIKTAQEAML